MAAQSHAQHKRHLFGNFARDSKTCVAVTGRRSVKLHDENSRRARERQGETERTRQASETFTSSESGSVL
ncbi:hypothetical protein K0M31_011217, partial [Melipona bicolor]